MGWIRCPGCEDVFDVCWASCPQCHRCPVCGHQLTGTEETCPFCDHPSDRDTIRFLERWQGIPETQLEWELHRADIRRCMDSPKAQLVFILLSLLVSIPLALVKVVLGPTVFFLLIVGGWWLRRKGLPYLLERGWFPWMFKDR